MIFRQDLSRMKSGTTPLTSELSHVSKSGTKEGQTRYGKGAAAEDLKDWDGGEKGKGRRGGTRRGEMNPGCTHRPGATPTP